MKKRLAALAVVLVILVFSIVAMFLWGTKKDDTQASPTQAPTPDDQVQIIKFNRDDAKQLTIKVPGRNDVIIGHTVKYEKPGDEDSKVDIWTYIPDPSIELDAVECSTVFSIMADLKGKKLDAEDIKDASLADFGLDEPAIVTVMMNDDKTEYVLHVGDFATGVSGTYVKLPDNDDIYLITEGKGLYLTSELPDFVNKSLFSKGEDQEFEKIKVVENGKLRFVIESYLREGSQDSEGEDKKVYDWRVIEPIRWNLNLGDARVFADSFATITATNVIDDIENLQDYGLDNPRYEITLTLNGKDHKLVLGDKDVTGQFYFGLWDDNKFIYTFSTISFSELDKPLKNMLSQMVYAPNYWELGKLEIWFENKYYAIDIKQAVQGDTSKDVIAYQGKTIRDSENPEVTSAFRNLYKGVLSLWADEIEPDAQPSGTPEIKFVFHNKSKNETVTVEYIRKDSISYYIMKDGKYTGVLTNIRNLDRPASDVVPGLKETLKNFLEKFDSVK